MRSSCRVIDRPSSTIGCRTVVSGGSVYAAVSMSSNPITATSSGTRRPASRSVRRAACAIRSEAANTASSSGSAASSSRMAAVPDSRVKSPYATSSGSPASVIAVR